MDKTFNRALEEFGESLSKLDYALLQFKEHPMYAEWLDSDEMNVMRCICGDKDCEECNPKEEVNEELIEELYE